MPDLFDLDNPDWWLATGPGVPLTVTVALWALAAVAVAYLRFDATLWDDLTAVTRREITIRDLTANGLWCDVCSTYWATSPVTATGPVPWLAVNGLYLLAAHHLPTLKPAAPTTPDEDDGLVVTEISTRIPPASLDATQTGGEPRRGDPPLPGEAPNPTSTDTSGDGEE